MEAATVVGEEENDISNSSHQPTNPSPSTTRITTSALPKPSTNLESLNGTKLNNDRNDNDHGNDNDNDINNGNEINDNNNNNNIISTTSSISISSCDELERYGHWLISIPRENVAMLQQTPEYTTFRNAFENLGIAHRNAILENQAHLLMEQQREEEDAVRRPNDDDDDGNLGDDDGGGTRMEEEANIQNGTHKNNNNNNINNNETNKFKRSNGDIIQGIQRRQRQQIQRQYSRQYSFLQHLAVDGIILRILEFLPCYCLTRTSETCHRFHQLSHTSAQQRTQRMAEGRYYLDDCGGMKLLRAKEQMDGILPDDRGGPVVRIPLLGLKKRIVVTNAGDEEYNGIYFCTGCNGNGFLFSKPRVELEEDQWRSRRVQGMNIDHANEDWMRLQQQQNGRERGNMISEARNDHTVYVNAEGEETGAFYVGRVLRCIIGKRFSNEVSRLSQFCLITKIKYQPL